MPSYRLGDGMAVGAGMPPASHGRVKVEPRTASNSSRAINSRQSSPILLESDEEEDPPSTSRNRPLALQAKTQGPAATTKDDIRIKLSKLDAEIKSVEDQLAPLQSLHASLKAERRLLEAQLSHSSRLPAASSSGPLSTGRNADSGVDYLASSFPWSDAVKSALKTTFGLTSFRLCQEGVINAAMDGRDIVCVMPTGGGKSLTYQLPAIAGARGLTVVISPLLALIWDQVRALKELGVECAMLTGATSKEEQNAIYKRIEESPGRGSKELRMVYLTPEKVSKSKRLMSVLEKANASGRLKRFVIDEAHCCSQLGHDFRPDYKKLSMLKTLFPRVPIQAVTATLSSKTMPDLLKILRLAPICDGRAANSSGTVFFSAPLFRPNLLYRVLPKPSSAKAAIEKMGQWINDHHPGKSGIIYCFSKKDAETVAASLTEWSQGAIKTGVYHAGIDDWQKERIHVNWRKGTVNCICATIAFGLGIDKGDVRYVIHHSMSKSLEGYYQETGRAGRDGQNSDCVLFYRGQDAAKLSSMVYNDVDGSGKMQEMLRFAQDLKTCRKVAFAKYFSTSTQLSAAAWDHPDALAASGGKITTCGICDNCTRDPLSIVTKDVTLESWKILRVLDEVIRCGGRVTLANLADLVRGLGGGSFAVPAGGKRKRAEPEKASLNLEGLIGGKITMNKDDTEALLIHLNLCGYLGDSFSATAYSVNVYVVPGPKAFRLSRLTLADIEKGEIGSPIECTFPNPEAKAKKARKAAEKKIVNIDDHDDEEDYPLDVKRPKERKGVEEERDAGDAAEGADGWVDEGEDWVPDDAMSDDFMKKLGPSPGRYSDDEEEYAGSSDRENGWKVIRGSPGRKRNGGSRDRAISLSE